MFGPMFQRPLLAGSLVAISLIGPGCGRSRDCTKLAEVANRRAAEIGQIEVRESTTPDTLATDMKALEEVAKHVVDDVEQLQFSDDALTAQAHEYSRTAEALGRASKSYAGLMDTLSQQRSDQKKAESEFQRSGQALLDACAIASSACNSVGDVLRKQPENPEPGKLVDTLHAYVEALEALDLQEGPVQKAVSIRIAATKAYEAVVTRSVSLDDDIESARGRIHEVVQKQNVLIGQLNSFCAGND